MIVTKASGTQAVRRAAAALVTMLPLLLLSLLVGAQGAHAASTDEDPTKIKATLTQAPIVNENPNNITMDVTIVNTATKKPPRYRYGVFLTAKQGDDDPILEQPENCSQVSDVDPAVSPGVYRCSVIINNPGDWTFLAYVNLPTANGQQQLKSLETTLTLNDAVVLTGEYKGLRYAVQGKSFEVFLLQIHVILASVWLLLVCAMAFIAVPRLRRMLSTLALQTLEVRRAFLNSSMWVTFGGTLITGTWLLTTQTAYKAPFSANKFSFNAYDEITRLPYASMYFNALYVKILIFLLMGGASTVLAMEAARQSQAAQDAIGDEDEIDMWATGVHFDEFGHVLHEPKAAGTSTADVAVATRHRPEALGISQRTLWACVAVMVGGTGVIGVCVTILKYCHELIETANAARILGG
ncbi:MAG TPA: hypothetical protein VNC22_05215 [Sporichthya sp.]|nr:hypothetical protein [Sporichthya sp.]